MKMKIAVIALLFMCLLGQAVFTQDAKIDERVVCVMDLVDFSEDSTGYETIGGLFADALALELELADYTVIDNGKRRKAESQLEVDTAALINKGPAFKFARTFGANVVITGFFRLEQTEVLFGIKAYDLSSGRMAFTETRSGTAGFEIFTVIEESAKEISEKVREALPPQGRGVPAKLRILSPDDGAIIFLGGSTPGGTIQDGRAVIDTKVDSDLIFTFAKPGYHSTHHEITITPDPGPYKVPPLMKKTQWDWSVFINPAEPIGLGGEFRWHFIENVLFTGGTTGLYYVPGAYNEEEFGNGLYHFRLGAGGGWYPFIPPTWNFRFALGMYLNSESFFLTSGAIAPVINLSLATELRLEYNFPLFSIYTSLYTVSPPMFFTTVPLTTNDDFLVTMKAGFTWKM